jgi:glycosyltransferase involved in cell wall biosynthesis
MKPGMATQLEASISVIIPYYNGSRFIADTLASVFAQDLPPLEIIVIDDGSRAEEAAVLQQFADRAQIIRQENAGVSAARNAGIAMARGRWIAFLDQDDRWEHNKLSSQWAYLAGNPHCLAVHTAVRRIKGDGQQVIHRKKVLTLTDFLLDDTNPSYLSSTLINRDALLRAGLFNPTLPYCQDWECFLRCSRHFDFHYVDSVLTSRIQHDANLSSNYLGTWHEKIRILRFYALQFKDDASYRARLYALHVKYGLFVISRRDFRGFLRIVKECRRDGFSGVVFLLRSTMAVVRNAIFRAAPDDAGHLQELAVPGGKPD